MSCYAYAKMVVGFQVREEDFYRVSTSTTKTCPQGHVQGHPNTPFCGLDGGKFQAVNSYEATPAMKALYEDLAFRLSDNAQSDYHDLWDTRTSRCFKIGDEHIQIVGSLLGGTGGWSSGPDIREVSAMTETLRKVEGLREKMGLTDRPIQTFMWIYYQ